MDLQHLIQTETAHSNRIRQLKRTQENMNSKTEKLFDYKPYDTDFQATIISAEPAANKIILDQTLFFPEEGGQTCDRGSLEIGGRTYRVIDVQIDADEVITHTVALDEASETKNSTGFSDDTLTPDFPENPVGMTVTGHIDWHHRFSNMQNHTGEHIFSGLVHAAKGYDNVGFHLSDNNVTMDYNGPLTDAEITDFEKRANQVIWQNLEVICEYPDAKTLAETDYRSKKELTGAVRLVTIPGVDVCACCAPHVSHTGEVGLLKVVNHQNYKGGTRLYILCGERALSDYVAKQDMIKEASSKLSTGWEELSAAVDRTLEQKQELMYSLSSLQAQMLKSQAAGVSADQADVYLFTECSDTNAIRKVINDQTAIHTGITAIFSGSDDTGYSYIAGWGGQPGRFADARDFSAKLKEKFGAKGGGKPEMTQGHVDAAAEKIKQFFY